jgi:hypothetical protein
MKNVLKQTGGGTATMEPEITNVVTPDPAPGAKVPRYHTVHLACPTPLTINPMKVETSDPSEAWREFCKANGISDSIHEKTITPLYS